MPRKRTAPLPRGIYTRARKSGDVYYICFVADGELVHERVGRVREEAESRLSLRRREVREGTFSRARLDGPITLAQYVDRYIEQRGARGRTPKTLSQIATLLRRWAVPTLGALALTDITTKHVVEWIERLLADGVIGAKTIRNAHGALSSCLTHAAAAGLIAASPARGLPRGLLPRIRKRTVPPYRRADVVALISDPRVPPNHRVLCALAAYGGLREGEACGLRWRDLDVEAEPLWRIDLSTQWDGETLKGPDGEGAPRAIPVHPELRAMLERWRATGFVAVFGRHPRPDDPIAPNASPHHFGRMFTPAAHQDQYRGIEALVGIAHVGRLRFHRHRSFFVSAAQEDGGAPAVLERVTHNAGGTTFGGYSHFPFPVLCAEVAKLRLSPPATFESSRLPRALGDATYVAESKTPEKPLQSSVPRGIRTRTNLRDSHDFARLDSETPGKPACDDATEQGSRDSITDDVRRAHGLLVRAGEERLARLVAARLAEIEGGD